MAVLLTPPFLQFFDENGDPLAEGKIYTYAAGTDTPKATYTTQAGDILHANPVELDAAGRAVIFILGAYKFVIKDADDVTIRTVDNVSSFTTTSASGSAFFQSFSGTGAQTAFTLSEDLGTEEKSIMVFVDAGGTKGYDVINPSAYTLNGTALTFSVAPASGTNNIYVFAPTLLVGEAAVSAAAADASATAAAGSQVAAAASAAAALVSETNAAASAAKLYGTSTTSVAIGTGSKAFTTQAGKFFDEGAWLLITSDANEANYMHGQVTAYSGTSLTVNVTNIGGSGTLADWTIRVSGTRGAQGPSGNLDFTALSTTAIELTDKVVFGDVSDSENAKKNTVSALLALAPQQLVLLSTQTASNSASIEFTSGITSTYKTYLITCENVRPTANNYSLKMRVSVDGGSNYLSTTIYETAGIKNTSTSGTPSYLNQAGANRFYIGDGANGPLPADTGDREQALIWLHDPSATTVFKCISFMDSYYTQVGGSTDVFTISYGGGGVATASAINAVQFFMDSGNISTGTFKLYGVL